MPVSGSMLQGKSWPTKAEPGAPRFSQVQPGTVLKRPIMCCILKSRRFEDIKYDTERYVWGIIWGMYGASSGACLGYV